ncbi:histidine--tRNA ligase [Maritimibacter sp. UBA3975]|uniref:histidine--tRNA ligase n=1 Tax=Maritimibacter sp. UBA3975 TaxID=1946833 RepID=UPI000C095549|nr:histidine--tRNA ligase [Maritimibacter sp. UBA3975]MAM63099.1 histidine--tRNA ligase [Maritimibacter sp.]|tara:strand:+ start:9145 stop:10704 length:1560 start_codon:yes stop_codon:yes gene_type:complete
MAKQKKQPRPKAETPKGFRDYFGADVEERRQMLDAIAGVYHRYGFDALESSGVETVEALGKFLPDVDRPNEGVFAWQDEDDTWMALRYDLTAPLARVYAQHRNDLPTPYRRYAMGPVWRNEKPGPGRYRQFYQCDADTVGTASMAADAEICAMLSDALEVVGIPRGDYVVRINNRKVLNGVLESIGLSEDLLLNPRDMSVSEAAEALYSEMVRKNIEKISREDVLRQVDKFDKAGEAGVRELLTDGRQDASGAFIDGVGLTVEAADRIIQFLTSKGDTTAATLDNLAAAVGDSLSGQEGVNELRQIANLLAAQGYGPERIVIDPSVVRGLGYYTGPVFEAELTFEILDDKGRPRQFGSVAGGGRYDDLVARFTGQTVPAVGVSIGVDRLLAALREKGRMGGIAQGPVVVTVMDRDRMADYQSMVAELRNAGIRAEVYLGNPKNFGNQMKYADRRGSPIAVIEGGDEKEKGVVQLKDLILGAKIAESATLEEWKDRPSQIEVSRADLVAEVRKMLDDQNA